MIKIPKSVKEDFLYEVRGLAHTEDDKYLEKSMDLLNELIDQRAPATFCVGDIHGNYLGLIDVMSNIKLKRDDTLVVLGDLCDGHPDTPRVIDYLLELSRKCNLILIRGNHDEWLQRWLNFKIMDPDWEDNGGPETIESYKNIDEETKRKHSSFLDKYNLYYIDDFDRVFVHGGFNTFDIRHECNSVLYWDRKLWRRAMSNHSHKFNKKTSVYDEIFIGHTATINFHNKPHYPEADGTNHFIDVPMKRCNVWNLDTGSGVSYGKLTIMNVDTKEYWQSKKGEEYYDL